MRKKLLIPALLIALVGLGSAMVLMNPTLVPRALAAVSGKAVTDFNVIVGPGFLDRMHTFSSTGLFRSDGSVIANGLTTVTVTRPDASVVNFRQRTDFDGRIRGFLFPEIITQTGTYQLMVDPDEGGVDTSSFTVTDPANASNLTSGTLNTDRLSDTFLASIGGNDSGTTYRGKSIIGTEENTSSTTYTEMATPDQVTVTLPEDGLISIDAQLLLKHTADACAAIFLDEVQLRSPTNNSVPEPAELCVVSSAFFSPVASSVTGFFASDTSGSADSTLDVTTGVAFIHNVEAGTTKVWAAAGTYTVSLRYKVDDPDESVTVKDRKLWVKAEGY